MILYYLLSLREGHIVPNLLSSNIVFLDLAVFVCQVAVGERE